MTYFDGLSKSLWLSLHSLELWRDRPEPLDARVHLDISADVYLPAGAENPWTTWKALNRLRTQVGRSRVNMLKWGFPTNQKPVTVASGIPCNTYWSAPWWTLPALPKTWQRPTTSPSALPGIGRTQFDWHRLLMEGQERWWLHLKVWMRWRLLILLCKHNVETSVCNRQTVYIH